MAGIMQGRDEKGRFTSGGINVGSLVVRLNGDASGYQRMLSNAQTQAKAFGKAMTTYVTAPLALVGGMALREFTKFDAAMTESLAIMQTTTDQQKRMAEQALQLAREGAKGPEELARSYFYLASAGLDAEASIKALPIVANFATAGAFDMAHATDLLTDAQSALGMTIRGDAVANAREMQRLADVLVKANVLANASVEQFSTALTSKAGSAMKVFNVSVEEGVAVLAAMADQGIKAELAGNNFARVLFLMSKASMDNQEAFRKYNFSLYNAQGNLRPLADIIENLEQVLNGLSAAEKSAALEALGFEARVQGAIMPLIGASEAIRRYYDELKKATGYVNLVAAKQMESLSWQLKNLWNNVKVAAIGIGEDLSPKVRQLSEWAKELVTTWQSLDTETRSGIVTFSLYAAAIGPVALGVAGLAKATNMAVTAFAAIQAGAAGATVGLAALSAVVIYFAVNAITDALAGVDEFNDRMKEMTREHARSLKEIAKLQASTVKEISELTGNDQLIAAQRAKQIAKATMDIHRKEMEAAGKRLQKVNLDVGWYRSKKDDIAMQEAEAEFQRAQELFDSSLDYYKAINGLQEELTKADEERTKATEGLEMARINEIKTGINDLNKSLNEANATMGMSEAEATRWKLAMEGADSAMLAETDRLTKLNKAMEKSNELAKRGKDLMEQYLSPMEKRIKREGELIVMYRIGAINRKVYNEALKASTKEYLDDMRERARMEQQFRNDKFMYNKAVTRGSEEMYQLMQLVPNAYRRGTPATAAPISSPTSLADIGKIEDQQYQVLKEIRNNTKPKSGTTVEIINAEM